MPKAVLAGKRRKIAKSAHDEHFLTGKRREVKPSQRLKGVTQSRKAAKK
jgi:hypothetical protein